MVKRSAESPCDMIDRVITETKALGGSFLLIMASATISQLTKHEIAEIIKLGATELIER